MGTVTVSEAKDGVRIVTMSTPGKLNAMDVSMWEDVVGIFSGADVHFARCLILTGEGSAFTSGHDNSTHTPGERMSFEEQSPSSTTLRAPELSESVYYCKVPVITAVRGWAVGAGCGLVIASTFCYAAPSAKFLYPLVKAGGIGFTGPAVLSHVVPDKIALECLLTGRPIDAQTALRAGLVNRITGEETLLEEAAEAAKEIASKDPRAVRLICETVRKCKTRSFSDALTYTIPKAIAANTGAYLFDRDGVRARAE